MRITYKKVKQWLAESEFAQEKGIHVQSWNDYYHLMDDRNNVIASAETPGKLWEMFCLYRRGYYLRVEEMKYEKN